VLHCISRYVATDALDPAIDGHMLVALAATSGAVPMNKLPLMFTCNWFEMTYNALPRLAVFCTNLLDVTKTAQSWACLHVPGMTVELTATAAPLPPAMQ